MKLMRFAIVSFLFAAIALLTPASAEITNLRSIVPAGFSHAIVLTVNGYDANRTTLEGFPVLVRISEADISGFDYDDVYSHTDNGKTVPHLAFIDDGGNPLAFEVDTWDTDGESLVWVKLSSMQHGTQFVMCYGSETAPANDPTQVWAAKYVGVWHMREESGAVADATGHDFTATPIGDYTQNSTNVVGKLGIARQNAVSGKYGNLVVSNDYDTDHSVGNTFTVSGWFYMTAENTNDSRLFSRKRAWDNETGGWETIVRKPADSRKLYMRGKTKSVQIASSSSGMNLNEWTHLVFAYNGGSGKIYVNGEEFTSTGSLDSSLPTENDEPLGIGGYNGLKGVGNASFFGYMDECRLFKATASADWVFADYKTQADETFLSTVGAATFVTWDVETNGGTMVVDTETVTTSIETTTLLSLPLTAPATPTKQDQVFVGWNTNSAATAGLDLSSFALTGPTTFYAIFADAVVRWYDEDGTTLLTPAFLGFDAETRPTHAEPAKEGNILFRYHFAGWRSTTDADTLYPTAGLPNVEAGDDISYMAVYNVEYAAPFVSELSRGVKFTVNGYTRTEVLTNFPVLVRLSESTIDGFHYGDFYADGSDLSLVDIGFVDADWNGLAYEIDTWNTNGESLVWVNLPRMTNGTEFAMWYRSAKTGKALNSGNVWADYTGVWHLNESGYGDIVVNGETINENTTIKDSSTNALDGAAQGLAASVAAGKIGGSWRISDEYARKDASIQIDLVDDPAKNAKVNELGDTFCASFWMKKSDLDTKWCVTGLNRRADGSTPGWGTQIHEDATQLRIYGNGGKNIFACSSKQTGFNSGEWDKIDVIWYNTNGVNGVGKMSVYWNGTTRMGGGELNPNTPIDQPSGVNLVMGNFQSATSDRAWSGELDEVRLIKGIPSVARIEADYKTVNDASFLTVGSVVKNTSFIERPVANLQVVDTGASHVQFGGALLSLGSTGASSCVFSGKVWTSAVNEPDEWTEFASGLTGGALSGLVKGLTPATAYSYKLKVTNNADVGFDEVEGSFTTSGVGVGGTGGDVTRIGDDWIHYFRVGTDIESGETINSYTFTPPSYATSVRALVVGGGGPGGYYAGGGGGAGGYIYNAALGVTPGAEYAIGVGTGGVATATATAYGSNGGNSSFVGGSGDGAVNLVAIGGGAGGNGKLNNQTATLAGKNGGSGGGTAWAGSATGSGTADQGHAGGDVPSGQWQQNLAAGGGGAAAVGGSIEYSDKEATKGSGVGGNGRSCDITGQKLYYAGGGGGGAKLVTNNNGTGVAGKGGNGGGGRGGQYDNTTRSQYAAAGKDGFGGGGGGGSTYSTGSYQGGDGGDGIVIIRYASQGDPSTVPEPIISLQSAVCNDETFQGDVTFRVAWAGYNCETADVKIAWGYSRNNLIHTTDVIATGVVGRASGSFDLIADECTVYCRAIAVNGNKLASESTETLSFYVNDNPKGRVDASTPILANVGISRADGLYAVVTGNVVSVGDVQDDFSNCVVRVNLGMSENNLAPAEGAYGEFSVGPFSLNITNLAVGTTYYYSVEAAGDDGTTVETDPEAFSTLLGVSTLELGTLTPISNQRIFSITGSLDFVGAGTTHVLAKWGNGEWAEVAAFNCLSNDTSFTAVFDGAAVDFAWGGTINGYLMCSNSWELVDGTPSGGQSGTATEGSSFTAIDAATYTWCSVNDDWNGDWDDTNHWSSDKADCRGYPNSASAEASFLNCTTNHPVVVTVGDAYEARFIRCFGKDNASDITFVGTDRTFSKLKGRFADYLFKTEMLRSDSRLEFRNMIVEHVGDNELMRDKTTVSNMTVRLDNVTATGKNYFSLSAPYSRLEFVNATTVTCTKVSIGGTDTVCLIDDSTLNLAQDFWAPADCTENNGLTVQFKGANPQIVTGTGNYGVRPHNSPGDFVRFEFAVPIGGYSLPPIQTPGNAKFAYANTNNANTPKYELVVDPDSPALKQASETFTNVLVYAAAGFYTNNMVEAIGTIPTHDYGSGDVPCGTFLWGSNDSPLEGEPPSVDDAKQILLELKGYGKRNGVLFLIY